MAKISKDHKKQIKRFIEMLENNHNDLYHFIEYDTYYFNNETTPTIIATLFHAIAEVVGFDKLEEIMDMYGELLEGEFDEELESLEE